MRATPTVLPVVVVALQLKMGGDQALFLSSYTNDVHGQSKARKKSQIETVVRVNNRYLQSVVYILGFPIGIILLEKRRFNTRVLTLY